MFGVDFSAAAAAGRRIWIASGSLNGRTLRVEDCRRAEDLAGSGATRDQCVPALRAFITTHPASIFGLDFPFGLPRSMVPDRTWQDFVLSFAERYPDPEAFRGSCQAAAPGAELRRETDLAARTPFSAYNLRLYRQTYVGIRDVLGPLIREGQACVLPMQRRLSGKPWLVEICPASTLKRYLPDLYRPYKGTKPGHLEQRTRILARLERSALVSIPDRALRAMILRDTGGDALDSVIAASAAPRALEPLVERRRTHSAAAIEGHVFV